MKRIILFFVVIISIGYSTQLYSQNLPVVNRTKKTFSLYMDNGDDTPLIYGYESATTSSKKMICFSSFTADIENNPHKCVLGAYYHSEEITIEYLNVEGEFVKLQFVDNDNGNTTFYIEKKYVKFE